MMENIETLNQFKTRKHDSKKQKMLKIFAFSVAAFSQSVDNSNGDKPGMSKSSLSEMRFEKYSHFKISVDEMR